MHVYITNLKWSTERRAHMEKQLRNSGIEYEFFDCVIGADLSDEDIAAKCNVESIKSQNSKVEWFTRGIIGCTMTNQNIYADIINRNYEYVLFLEDDTVLPPNLNDILEFTAKQIRQGDVVLLFWKAWNPLKLRKPEIKTSFGFDYYQPVNYKELAGGSAYIVTQRAAQKMIESNTPIHTTPDNWKYYYDNGSIERLLVAYPLVVQTADFKSTMRIGKFLAIRDLVERYKIFPFYQLLKLKRKQMKNETLKVEFID